MVSICASLFLPQIWRERWNCPSESHNIANFHSDSYKAPSPFAFGPLTFLGGWVAEGEFVLFISGWMGAFEALLAFFLKFWLRLVERTTPPHFVEFSTKSTQIIFETVPLVFGFIQLLFQFAPATNLLQEQSSLARPMLVFTAHAGNWTKTNLRWFCTYISILILFLFFFRRLN